MGYLGKYYAAKIRGGIHLHAFQVRGSFDEKKHAVQCLETALEMWKEYAHAATCNYRPQFMAKARTIDWTRLIEDVRGDIEIAETATQTCIQEFAPNTQLAADSRQPTATPAPTVEPGAPISVYYDRNEATIVFAAQDIQKVLSSKGYRVHLQSIANLLPLPEPLYIVIAQDSSQAVLKQLQNRGGQSTGTMADFTWQMRSNCIIWVHKCEPK